MAILTQTRARPGWWAILRDFWAEIDRDHVSIMAAGIAFYALLSIFPGMSALISIYGLVADPITIENQLSSLSGILPQEALKLLSDQLHALVAAPRDKLGLGLVVGLLLALWSATSGTGALMQALTVAYEERDNRGTLSFYGGAIALTLAIGVFALLSLFLIAGIPAVIGSLPLAELWRDRISLIRWPLLAILALVAMGVLYRYAPARRNPCWHCFSAGTIGAAVLWLVGSAGFSFYVARFSSYDKTYGSLGAVVILLMWFYVTAYIILAGAELNSEIEKARERG
jgi:membrane protein